MWILISLERNRSDLRIQPYSLLPPGTVRGRPGF